LKSYAGFIVGIALGALGMWLFLDGGKVYPEVVEGTVYPDVDTEAVGFTGEDGKAWGYVLSGAEWIDDQNTWHEWSNDNCLEPTKEDQPIRMGVVHTEPSDGAAGRGLVVWFDCL